MDGASPADGNRRLHFSADRVEGGALLPAHVLYEHSSGELTSASSLARVVGAGVRHGNGLQGDDGDGAVDRSALRSNLRLRFVQTGTEDARTILFRPRSDLDRARRITLVGAALGVGRILHRDHAVDLSAEPGRHGRAVSGARILASRVDPR